MAEQIDSFLASADVAAAGATEGFAECAGIDVDAIFDATEFRRAATFWPHEADGVAVIDHNERVVFIGEVTDLFKGAIKPSMEKTPSVTMSL